MATLAQLISEWPCKFCGAWDRRGCEMEDETGVCMKDEAEPDPDLQREDQKERRDLDLEHGGY